LQSRTNNDVAGGIQESEEYYDEQSQGQLNDDGALDMEDIKVAQNE